MQILKPIIILITGLVCFTTNLCYSQMELPVINDLTTTPSLIPYRKGDVWGYADYAGNIVIKPQYREARFFCGELACVTLIDLEKESLFNYNAGNFQIINKKGEIIVEVAQTSIYTITDTTALIINENPFIIDNHKNKYDLSEFNDIIYEGPFGTGKKNGACYLLDSKGSVIKQMNCDSMVEQGVFNNEHQMIIKPLGLGPFKNGLAHMENANDYQYMDRSGNIYTCLNPTIDRLASSWHICPDPFKNNVAVLEQNGKSGVIDNMGNVIIPFGKYYSIDAFSDGMSMVRTSADNDEIIFINTKGQELKPKSNFMFYEVFSGGFARIYFLKGKFNDGFINKSGKSFMLKKTYDQIGLFSDGLCMVKSVEGRFGFIDTTGKETIPANLEYEEVDQFSNGLCRVKSNGLYGFIDRTGKEVIPCTIPEAMPFENGISQLNLKPCDYCNIYLLNKAGETLPYYFQTNDEWINGFHVIHDNTTNLIGVIDETNRIVVEPQYSRINIYPFGIAELIISYEEFYSKSYINLKTGTKYFSE